MQILAYVAPPTTGRDGHRSRMRGEGGGGGSVTGTNVPVRSSAFGPQTYVQVLVGALGRRYA